MNIQRRMWLYLVLLLLALGTMYWLNKSAKASQEASEFSLLPRDYDKVQSEGILRLVAPYYLSRIDSVQKGSLPRLMQQLRSRSGLEVQVLLEDNADKALELLREGYADLVLHPIERTDRLDTTTYTWLKELVAAPIYLVQRRDSTGQASITKQFDLEQDTIVLPRNSSMKLFVEHLSEDLGVEVRVIEDSLYNTEQLIIKVQAGSINYTLCSGEEATRYAKLFPGLDFGLPMSHHLRRGWITRRSAPALSDSLNLWLK